MRHTADFKSGLRRNLVKRIPAHGPLIVAIYLIWRLVYPHPELLLQGKPGFGSCVLDVPGNDKTTAIIAFKFLNYFCECHGSITTRGLYPGLGDKFYNQDYVFPLQWIASLQGRRRYEKSLNTMILTRNVRLNLLP
ncbi:uncharacterized protein ARMOST_19001 [Armillaria ostoyae]|uniref:Uncharacterized protein n=1 Tax=Armillaria ostoyae TaxID=47428 RepID=A0A284S3B4_ARMOS|nr:uncharacterized protein ARMOST_19001 [Armillaria ostoyae]